MDRENGESMRPALSAAERQQIDRFCDAFEERWKGWSPPQIETVGQEADLARREELLGELLAIAFG